MAKRSSRVLAGGIIILLFYCVCYGQVSLNPTYSINDLQFSTLQGFDVVELQGCYFYTDKLGKPLLPAQSLQILLPKDAEPESIYITFKDSVQVEGDFYIYPTQQGKNPRNILTAYSFCNILRIIIK